MELTIRDLVRGFPKASHTALRRWTLLALGKDPEADQAGGVARKFSFSDGFLVYLLGYLIREARLSQDEAQEHVKILKEVLNEKGLLPQSLGETQKFLKEIELRFISPSIYILIWEIETKYLEEDTDKKESRVIKDYRQKYIEVNNKIFKRGFKIKLNEVILDFFSGISKVK